MRCMWSTAGYHKTDHRDILSDRGVAISSRSTLCMDLIWFWKPVRGSKKKPRLSRGPNRPSVFLNVSNIWSQIPDFEELLLLAFSNAASVCVPSSSPSVLDDWVNPCFDPAAKSSTLKTKFSSSFFFWLRTYLAHSIWTHFDCWSIFSPTYPLYTCLLPQLRPQREAW